MKKITIDQFLTKEEIKKLLKLRYAKDIHDQIIKPNIDRINESLGQENDPMFLSYACEYVLNEIRRK